MAKRGGKNHLKRIAVSPKVKIHNKKEYTFLVNPGPGPHPKAFCVPLAVVLRDLVGIAKTRKEAKIALNEGLVRVDGKVRRDLGYPVGFMDVVEILDKSYRMVVDNKGRLILVEDQKGLLKPLKIKNKVSVGKDLYQLTFHDGRTYLTSDNNYKIGDVVLFDLENNQIKEVVKPEKGRECLIVEGRHAGLRAVLEEIVDRKGKKEAVLLTKDNEKVITKYDYIFPLPEGW